MKTYDELKALIEQRGVHAVFGDYGEGWAIEQNADELAEFLVACQEQGIENVLEIGTGYRAGLARFLHEDMGWQVTSVDIHDYGHQFGGIQFIASDGVELPVFSQQFDLVIIDADHSYDGVNFDHDYYGKYADKIIMFHDIAGLRDCEGVAKYWWKIAYHHPAAEGHFMLPGYHEIFARTPEEGGIGYIVLSEVQAEPERVLKDVDPAQSFSVVGESKADEPAKAIASAKKPAPVKKTPAKKPATTRKTAAKK